MNKENIKVEGPGSQSGGDCDPRFKDKGPDAGGPVMRAGTDKDWRGAPKAGSSDKSGGSDRESVASTGEAQNEPPNREPSAEPQREGTWKDWRSAEIDRPDEGVPKPGQSPRDQRDTSGSDPGPMRDGTPREP